MPWVFNGCRAVIGVWAASTQNLSAGFNVNYSVGENVAAKVRTEYFIPNSGEEATAVVTDKNGEEVSNENGYVVFNAGDSTATKEVYIGDFDLTPTTPEIIFYFTIYNMLEEGYIQVLVNENYTAKENVKVKTSYYNTTFDTTKVSLSTYLFDEYSAGAVVYIGEKWTLDVSAYIDIDFVRV